MANALTPPPAERIEIRRVGGSDKTIWIVLGLVAVVAIVALIYIFTQDSAARQQAAIDQAVVGQHSVDVAGQASSAADQAARSASLAASVASDAASHAARAVTAPANTAAVSPLAPAPDAAGQTSGAQQ